jgi:hypothetical protein
MTNQLEMVVKHLEPGKNSSKKNMGFGLKKF